MVIASFLLIPAQFKVSLYVHSVLNNLKLMLMDPTMLFRNGQLALQFGSEISSVLKVALEMNIYFFCDKKATPLKTNWPTYVAKLISDVVWCAWLIVWSTGKSILNVKNKMLVIKMGNFFEEFLTFLKATGRNLLPLLYCLSSSSFYGAALMGTMYMQMDSLKQENPTYSDRGYILFFIRFFIADVAVQICYPLVSFQSLLVVFASKARVLKGLFMNIIETILTGIITALIILSGYVNLSIGTEYTTAIRIKNDFWGSIAGMLTLLSLIINVQAQIEKDIIFIIVQIVGIMAAIYANISVCAKYSSTNEDWSLIMFYQSVVVGFCAMLWYIVVAIKQIVTDVKKTRKKSKSRRTVEDELAAMEN